MPTGSFRGLRVAGLGLVAIGIGLAAVGALYKPNTTIPPGAAGTTITVRDTPLRVLQTGKGRDVLLIHGSPGSVEDWEPVLASASDSFRFTAYDRPGHGYSGDPGEYSYAFNADMALALIASLKLEHVIVVGHSYGGATALAMAERAPAQVDAYVIIDSSAYQPSRAVDGTLRIAAVPLVGMGFLTLLGPLVAPGKIRQGLREVYAGHPVSEDFIAPRIVLWSTPKVAHATAIETAGAAEGLRAQSDGYPRIAKPVVIIAEADSPVRRETAEHLHRDIAGSSLHLIPDTGHMIQFEKTPDVVAAIREAAQKSAPASAAAGAPSPPL